MCTLEFIEENALPIIVGIATIIGVVYKIIHTKKKTKIAQAELESKQAVDKKQQEVLEQQKEINRQEEMPKFELDPINPVIYNKNDKIAFITLINEGETATIQSTKNIIGRIVKLDTAASVKKNDIFKIHIQAKNDNWYSFSIEYVDIFNNKYQTIVKGKEIGIGNFTIETKVL